MNSTQNWVTPAIRKKVETLISRMTLEEKVGQMTQYDWGYYDINPDFGTEQHQQIQDMVHRGWVGSIFNLSGVEEANRLQKMMRENTRLGIPLLIGRDVIHGYRTVFPIPLAQSSSWNPELVKRAAAYASREASTEGISWVFAPMIDISRDPRWGRMAEGMGEDPYLTSVFAKAWVEGAQMNDWQGSLQVASCPKHYAAYGLAEAGRDYNTVDLSDSMLREVILPPFKTAVESGALSIMASFNEINGIPACANRYLLTTILREEWGFEGIVVSDYNAVYELISHGIAANEEEACEISIKAGTDMDMHSGIYMRHLPNLVRQGKVPEELVDQAVRRILAVKYKLNLFDQPFVDSDLKNKVILSEQHLETARQLAKESIVLLKNDDKILPLSKELSAIAVIGPLADNKKDPLGCWSFDGKPEDVVSLLDGMKEGISSQTAVYYAQGCGIEDESEDGIAEAVELASKADISVIAVGEGMHMSGESHSRTNLDLPGKQKQLIEAVARLGKPFVIIMMNGRPLTIPWLHQLAPAIVETRHLGVQSGYAIADVLFGDYNPCGKITASYPHNVGQIPIYYYRKNTGRPPAGNSTSNYLDAPTEPLYPFGFGLSYTEFKYDSLRLSSERISVDENLTVSVEITNVGEFAGDEIAQLYLRDVAASVTRPLKLLKGFQKVKLQPGETQTLKFSLTASDLALIDADMNLTVEPGTFHVWVGPDSSRGLFGEFTVTPS